MSDDHRRDYYLERMTIALEEISGSLHIFLEKFDATPKPDLDLPEECFEVYLTSQNLSEDTFLVGTSMYHGEKKLYQFAQSIKKTEATALLLAAYTLFQGPMLKSTKEPVYLITDTALTSILLKRLPLTDHELGLVDEVHRLSQSFGGIDCRRDTQEQYPRLVQLQRYIKKEREQCSQLQEQHS